MAEGAAAPSIEGRDSMNGGSTGLSSLMPVLAIGVAIVVLVVSLVGVQRQRRRVMEFANANNLGFTAKDRELGKYLRGAANVSGSSHMALNVLQSTTAERFQYGNLRWTTGSGDDKTTHYQEFFLFPIPANFPNTRIQPEGFFGRAMNDINTEWMEFNKEWDVRSDNPQFASALLNPRMQEFLMGVKGYAFHIRSGNLLIMGGRYNHERCFHFRDAAVQWRGLVVPFLWQDYGTGR